MIEKSKGKSQKVKLQFKIKNFDFWLVVLSFTFLLLACQPFFLTAVEACPMCKDSLFDPGQLAGKISTAKGYALSIGLLLLVPFVLIASVTALVIRASRRAKAPTHF